MAGAVAFGEGSGSIHNSVLVGNSGGGFADDVFVNPQASVTFGTNVISAHTSAGGTIITATADEVFANSTVVNGIAVGTPNSDNTVELKSGGPAVDAGVASDLPTDTQDLDGDGDTSETLPVDQVGNARQAQGGLDLGAAELPQTFEVTTLTDTAYDGGTLAQEIADDGFLSLREAIGLINGLSDLPGTEITFQQGLTGTIELTSTGNAGNGRLVLTNSADIVGPGITIDGNGQTEILQISGGQHVSLTGLTLTAGQSSGFISGTIFSTAQNLTLTDTTLSDGVLSGFGFSGLTTTGNLNLINSSITGMEAQNSSTLLIAGGGGAFVGGDLYALNSTISDNKATQVATTIAGDVSIEGGGIRVTGDATIIGGSIQQNEVVNANSSGTYSNGRDRANLEGGGVYVGGDLFLASTLVNSNNLMSSGGGQFILARGGGVSVGGNAFIENAEFALNNASLDQGNAEGGGIYVGGAATLDKVTVRDGTITAGKSAASSGTSSGAGAFIYGLANVSDSVIDNNYIRGANLSIARGGGLALQSGGTVENTTISNNAIFPIQPPGRGFGGGVYTSGATSVIGSTVSGNKIVSNGYSQFADDGGAGIAAGFGSLSLVNTTIYGNEADNSSGGGLIARNGTPVSVVNSTITGNHSEVAGGGIVTSSGTVTISNSIIAGNNSEDTDDNDLADFGTPQDNFVNAGGNVLSSQAAAVIGPTTNVVTDTLTNIFESVNAVTLDGNTFNAGVLGDTGGPVKTVLIKSDGVAVDAGLSNNLPNDTTDADNDANTSEALPIDARGAPRQADYITPGTATPDAGAVELESLTNLVVTTVDDEVFDGGTLLQELADGNGLSLREAIGLVNAGNAGGSTITFDLAGATAPLSLTQGALQIQGTVTVDGLVNGQRAAINANSQSRIFNIDADDGDAVILKNLFFSRGFDAGGGTILLQDGDLTLQDSAVFGSSSSTNGGAILADADADGVTVTGVAFSGGSSSGDGGAIHSASAPVTVSNSSFGGVQASGKGGAIFAGGTLEVTGTNFSGNISAGNGGAVYASGTASFTNTTFGGNAVRPTSGTTEFFGGGLFFNGTQLDVADSGFFGNNVDNSNASASIGLGAGGLAIFGSGTFSVTDTSITNNTVTQANAGQAVFGGGVVVAGSTTGSIVRSLIADNSVSTNGGNVTGGNVIAGQTATLHIDSSLVEGAQVTANGGNIFGGGIGVQGPGNLRVTNSTIHGNQGDGVWVDSDGGASSAVILNSTIALNTGLGVQGVNSNTKAQIGNSVVVGNTGTADVGSTGNGGVTLLGGNVAGTLVGGNFVQSPLDSTNAPAAIVFANGGVLEDLGGNLLSVAINPIAATTENGFDAFVPDDRNDLDTDSDTSEDVPFDVRGFARRVDFDDPSQAGGKVDSGAVEFGPITLVVTTLEDEAFDSSVPNALDGSGLSLREAIEIANRNPGADTITFDASLSGGTIYLSTLTDMDITESLTIDGDLDNNGTADITIDADSAANADNAASRHFDIHNAASLTVDGLVLRDGDTTAGAQGGGSIRAGSGTHLTLTNTTITNNTSGSSGALYMQAGPGVLNITGSTITNNTTTGAGAGGLYLSTGIFGIIESSLFSGNASTDVGGAGAIDTTADLLIISNTTIANNSDAYSAGGIWVGFNINGAGLSLTNTTVAGNFSGSNPYSGLDATAPGTRVSIVNSIISGNSGTTAEQTSTPNTLQSSLIGADPSQIFATTAANALGVTTGVLADNGGQVQTVALKTDGIAINAADPVLISVSTDARGTGFARDVGLAPDIGAYESQTPVNVLTVTTLDDEAYDGGITSAEQTDGSGLSLREAIALANSSNLPTTITFAQDLSGGTLYLSQGSDLDIRQEMTIDGDLDNDGTADITIDADSSAVANDAASRVFEITNPNNAPGGFQVTLEGLNIRDGDVSGGAFMYGGGVLANAFVDLTLNSVNVVQNAASAGGGVGFAGLRGNAAMGDSGSLHVSGSTISGNTSTYGGGGVSVSGTTTVTIDASTISGNTSGTSGGGIFSSARTLVISNTTIADNERRAKVVAYGRHLSSSRSIRRQPPSSIRQFQGTVQRRMAAVSRSVPGTPRRRLSTQLSPATLVTLRSNWEACSSKRSQAMRV
ncbi:MAG: choice-of-anchor Q domain-containing protein [Pseudomonadota bacterium]